jgi:hypothetical protein
MDEDLVDIFEATTLAQAQLLVQRLDEAGIKTFVDNTDSPFDGLTAADQYKVVRVLPTDAEKAGEIAKVFAAEEGQD